MEISKLIGDMLLVKCPRCGGRLKQTQLRNSRVNRCGKGCGIWIDQQQLDQLSGMNSKRYEVTEDLPARFLGRGDAI